MRPVHIPCKSKLTQMSKSLDERFVPVELVQDVAILPKYCVLSEVCGHKEAWVPEISTAKNELDNPCDSRSIF